MALINCPDCGTEVSDAAPACPKCGRPIAPPTPQTHARGRGERNRSPATFTITVSSFVLIVLAIAAAVWFVPALEIGQNLATSCQVNGTGQGSCQFTNTGWTPGSQCIDVGLRNQQGGDVRSGPVCSGRVWPNDTAEKNVMLVIGHICDGPLGFPDLSKVCTMDIRNVDSSDADTEASSLPDAQPEVDAGASTGSASGANAEVSSPSAVSSAISASPAPTAAAMVPDPDTAPVTASSTAQATQAASSEPPEPQAPSVATTPAADASVSPVLQAVIAKTAGPSFDCTKATSATALTICSNTDLSGLDRQMAILYYSRTNYATDQAVRDGQRAWLQERDQCGADLICLRKEYAARIQQLQQ